MKRRTSNQSGGVNIEHSEVDVDGDLVGRDKITYHGPNPDQEWEDYDSAGCVGQALMIVGILGMIGGFIAFAALGYLSVQRGPFGGGPTPFLGWGIMLAGMLMYGLGRAIGSRKTHLQRRNSRRK